MAVAFSYSVAQGDGGMDRSSTARVELNGSVRFGELQHNDLRNSAQGLCHPLPGIR
jgi:hypothetical protein